MASLSDLQDLGNMIIYAFCAHQLTKTLGTIQSILFHLSKSITAMHWPNRVGLRNLGILLGIWFLKSESPNMDPQSEI
jgi:hypothetical protein